ncbi:MAG: hypothetical protein MUE85_19115 [Microscillaceae bacterium]|nr:hypothetical protein [Microscillaceae bacterium]
MKKNIAISLLFVLFFQVAGSYLVFRVWQMHLKWQAKRQILQSLPPENLTLLVLDTTAQKQLEWEDDREFRYQGAWYDVVRVEVQQSITYYYCYLDKQETKLIEKFSYLLDLEAFKQKNHSPQAQHIFKKIIEQPSFMSLWQYVLGQIAPKPQSLDFISQLPDNQLVTKSPPPELFALNS